MATETEDNYRNNGNGGGAPSGMRRARLALAISAGKLAGASGRFFRIGGGTSLPGMIARRIDPDVLKSVIGASKAKKIVITGSNGKTTTARMTAAIADASGQRISQNRSGSNMRAAHFTEPQRVEYAAGSDFRGRQLCRPAGAFR